MPSHDGVGPDEHEGRAPVPPRLGQHDPEQAIPSPETRAFSRACEGMELLAESEVLEHQFVVAAAGQGERSRDPEDGSQHWVILSCETCENQHGSSAGCTFGERQPLKPGDRVLTRHIIASV
jgi:hypothetical protein